MTRPSTPEGPRAKLTSSQHFRWHIYFTVYLFHFFFVCFICLNVVYLY